MKSKACKIQGLHCEMCGNPVNKGESTTRLSVPAPGTNHTLPVTLHYSLCCNELISYGPEGCRGFHCRTDKIAVAKRAANATKLAAQEELSTVTCRKRFGLDFCFSADGRWVWRADGKAEAYKYTKADGEGVIGWVIAWNGDWDGDCAGPFTVRRNAVEMMASAS